MMSGAEQRFSPRRSSASAYDYDEGLEMESWDCRLLARDYPSTKLNEQSLCQPRAGLAGLNTVCLLALLSEGV